MNPKDAQARTIDDEATALLVRAARERDERAFSELYDRLAPLLFGLACRILGSKTDAEDALQEALMQAWRQADAFDPAKGSARAWLVTLTRSRSLDRLRRRASALRREGPLPEGDAAPAAIEDSEREQERRAVLAALAALPEPQRRALEAAYFEGLTQAEISAKTGEPLGTVKTRMRLGMIKLMEALRSPR